LTAGVRAKLPLKYMGRARPLARENLGERP